MGGVGHTPTPSRSHRGGKFPHTYSEPIHREGETPIRTREHYYPPLDRERGLSGLQNRWFSSASHIDFECLHCWMDRRAPCPVACSSRLLQSLSPPGAYGMRRVGFRKPRRPQRSNTTKIASAIELSYTSMLSPVRTRNAVARRVSVAQLAVRNA